MLKVIRFFVILFFLVLLNVVVMRFVVMSCLVLGIGSGFSVVMLLRLMCGDVVDVDIDFCLVVVFSWLVVIVLCGGELIKSVEIFD